MVVCWAQPKYTNFMNAAHLEIRENISMNRNKYSIDQFSRRRREEMGKNPSKIVGKCFHSSIDAIGSDDDSSNEAGHELVNQKDTHERPVYASLADAVCLLYYFVVYTSKTQTKENIKCWKETCHKIHTLTMCSWYAWNKSELCRKVISFARFGQIRRKIDESEKYVRCLFESK